MIERYFIKYQTQDRIRASWLGEPIQRYVTWLHEQQYAARSVYRCVPILMRFADYAQSCGAKIWIDFSGFGSTFRQAMGRRARDSMPQRTGPQKCR